MASLIDSAAKERRVVQIFPRVWSHVFQFVDMLVAILANVLGFLAPADIFKFPTILSPHICLPIVVTI